MRIAIIYMPLIEPPAVASHARNPMLEITMDCVQPRPATIAPSRRPALPGGVENLTVAALFYMTRHAMGNCPRSANMAAVLLEALAREPAIFHAGLDDLVDNLADSWLDLAEQGRRERVLS